MMTCPCRVCHHVNEYPDGSHCPIFGTSGGGVAKSDGPTETIDRSFRSVIQRALLKMVTKE